MVWSYFPTRTPLQYVQNPSEGLWNVAGWNVYLPLSKPDAAALTNLFAIQARQAYLVKISGPSPVTLNVTGTPSYREIAWQPDGFTLTGFALDPAATVRFGDFFFNSPAHKSQSRYFLSPSGNWTALSDSSIMKRGVAYWCFSKGPSNFSAPVALKFGGGDTLDFGQTVETQKLVIANQGATATNVTVNNQGGLPLTVANLNEAAGATDYAPLTSVTKNIPAGSEISVTLGLSRSSVQGEGNAIVTVTGQGTMRTLVVSGQSLAAAAGRTQAGGSRAAGAGSNPESGLWVGSVVLNAVSEPHGATPTVTTKTPAEFAMRLLLHVDGNGTTRLLKEAILMKQPNGTGDPAVGGDLVLLSDPALIPQFQAPDNHEGSPFAHRVSSIGYDFDGADAQLGGAFGGSLTGTLVLGRDRPTNPFKHLYHPDHDDLTPTYQPPGPQTPSQEEVWAVTRSIVMTFSAPAAGDNSPGASSTRTGTYTETIVGLHKTNLVTAGTFTLRRLNNISEINPAPAQ
jgi:hypothetical protein